jgi:hypothetical protein
MSWTFYQLRKSIFKFLQLLYSKVKVMTIDKTVDITEKKKFLIFTLKIGLGFLVEGLWDKMTGTFFVIFWHFCLINKLVSTLFRKNCFPCICRMKMLNFFVLFLPTFDWALITPRKVLFQFGFGRSIESFAKVTWRRSIDHRDDKTKISSTGTVLYWKATGCN